MVILVIQSAEITEIKHTPSSERLMPQKEIKVIKKYKQVKVQIGSLFIFSSL